jgi:hypothetical protein
MNRSRLSTICCSGCLHNVALRPILLVVCVFDRLQYGEARPCEGEDVRHLWTARTDADGDSGSIRG